MLRVGSACLVLLATAVTVSGCSGGSETEQSSAGDACTEVQHEIDLVRALQQGETPSDPQGEMQRLNDFRPKAPAEISRYYSTMQTYIVNHLERSVPDPPAVVIAANLEGLTGWKGTHCLNLAPRSSTSPSTYRNGL